MPDTDSTLNLGSLLLLFALLAINGLAVAAEYAFVRVRRSRLDELVVRGVAGASSARHVTEHLDRYIAATQLLITMSGVGLGYVGEPALSAIFEPIIGQALTALDETVRRTISVLVALIFVTAITVVISELVPKTWPSSTQSALLSCSAARLDWSRSSFDRSSGCLMAPLRWWCAC